MSRWLTRLRRRFARRRDAFDVILLDLMLPDGDGLDLLNTLRSRHIQTPVLVLTARDAVDDQIAGSTAVPTTTSSSRSRSRRFSRGSAPCCGVRM
jgi:DNA-binding response OmpR family regulator